MYLIPFLRQLLSISAGTLLALLSVRAICSWLFPGAKGSFFSFLYAITEAVISPIRRLCDRNGWFRGSFFDVPFLITYLLLSLVQMLASA